MNDLHQHRLFVCLWPDAEAVQGLQAWQQAIPPSSGARYVPTPNLHLTIHFVGDVGAERLASVIDGLAIRARPVEVVLDRLENWADGLVVLAASETPLALARLHADVGESLRSLDLPGSALAFRPHVTLARRVVSPVTPPAAPPTAVRLRCARFGLVESSAGEYRELASYQLPA
jgi:2'-5' RNA ligase